MRRRHAAAIGSVGLGLVLLVVCSLSRDDVVSHRHIARYEAFCVDARSIQGLEESLDTPSVAFAYRTTTGAEAFRFRLVAATVLDGWSLVEGRGDVLRFRRHEAGLSRSVREARVAYRNGVVRVGVVLLPNGEGLDDSWEARWADRCIWTHVETSGPADAARRAWLPPGG